jgi:hypothetical protein
LASLRVGWRIVLIPETLFQGGRCVKPLVARWGADGQRLIVMNSDWILIRDSRLFNKGKVK